MTRFCSAESEEEGRAEEDSESVEPSDTVLVTSEHDVLKQVRARVVVIDWTEAGSLSPTADHTNAFWLDLGWSFALSIREESVVDTQLWIAEEDPNINGIHLGWCFLVTNGYIFKGVWSGTVGGSSAIIRRIS